MLYVWASLAAQTVKRLPTTWETWVRSLGREDPLEKEIATRSSILAWEIPWAEELGELQQMGWQRVGHDLATRQSGEFRKKQGRRKRYRQETHQTGLL